MQTITESDFTIKNRMIDGSEGRTFRTNLGIYKKFHNSVADDVRLIKIQQLYYLDTLNLIKNYFPELRFIVEDEKILGYIMEEVFGFGLDSREFDFDTKVYLLRVISEKLKTLADNNILIFDIRNPNIHIEDIEQEDGSIIYNPRFLEADSVVIKDFKENHEISSLKKYLKHGGKKDIKAENFMFNNYTASVLSAHKPEYDKIGYHIIKCLNKNKPDSYADNELLLEHIISHQK